MLAANAPIAVRNEKAASGNVGVRQNLRIGGDENGAERTMAVVMPGVMTALTRRGFAASCWPRGQRRRVMADFWLLGAVIGGFGPKEESERLWERWPGNLGC